VETSTQPATDSRQTAVVGLDEDSNYRTPSVLAIVSLIVGLSAPLVFFAPLLMAIPIAGVVLAFMAIRQINTSEGTLIGLKAAHLALAISVACIAAAFVRTSLTQELLSRQARTTACEWIALLQSGDAEKAFQLTSASRQSAPKAPPGSPEESAQPQVAPLDAFRADPVVHFLLEQAHDAPAEYVRDEAFDLAATSNARIQQLYKVAVPASEGLSPDTTIEVILQRVRGYAGSPAEWQVAAYQSKDLPAGSTDGHAGHVH
jgi:hypothetical protein